MVSAEKLVVFLKLQQIVLDSENNSSLLNILLPQALALLPSAGLGYEFIAAVFIDGNNQPNQSFCSPVPNCADVINITGIFTQGSAWEKELLWGKVIVAPASSQLVNPSYPGAVKVKSVIISPTHLGKKLIGALVLISNRESNKVSQEELEIVELITHLVSLAYKIQDTQSSLIQVTQEVYKMNAQLHQLDKLKDDFVSVASHELRTPMTAVRSYVWMALNRPDIELSDKMKRYLSRTLISTERLINLVNDMLNVSRIESGRVEITPKAFDITALAVDIVEDILPKAQEKKIRIDVLKTPVPLVFADSEKVQQVLLNLLGNALKFTPIEGNITISFLGDGNGVDTSVKDNGVGISKDDLGGLFKKFGRLDNSYVAAATSGGTGLGLYISRSLVELMGGKIWASSEGLGKGTTFTFFLPAATKEVIAQAQKYTKTAVGGEAKALEPVAI